MVDVQVARPGADIAVVALHGEHDLTTKEQFASLLSTEITDNELVVVDVSDADFIDTSVLHNLIRADQLARAGGSRFVLQMGTARIVRLAIEISGVLDSLTWAGSREEALRPDMLVTDRGYDSNPHRTRSCSGGSNQWETSS